jgi:diadenosine tetraphosphatase ApaH/serine/threonine PP2A family protein phosphatase
MDREINEKRLINPGSVGQPRNGGYPTYGVFDTKTGIFKIKEITYDVQIVVEEVRQVEKYNAHLISVLEMNSR